MENKKFVTRTTATDLFRFQIYHMYMGVMGFLLGLLAVVALADLIGNFSNMTTGTRAICIILILWAIVLNPVNMYFRAKKQAQTVELFKNPIELEIDEKGLTIIQGENGGLVEWKNITKIVILKKLAIFYMGKVRAHLLPLDQIPETADEAVELVKKHATGIKLVNRRKSRRKQA
ncbi:MAG: YcxB family protein [Lachnospiraceae bacterium]|nr:YcxB family protein [Lachnospiraceae bacterium]